MRPDAWHSHDTETVLKKLGSHATRGLESPEAASKLSRHGLNALAEGKRRGVLGIFFSQFADFMVLVLLAACAVSALIGDIQDTVAILTILAVNAAIGFIQEYRAERAMQALKAMAAPTATVLRDGQTRVIPAREIVPGDVVLLDAGSIVPSDLRLVDSARLRVDESALTGESAPVEKSAGLIHEAEAAIGDRRNMAYKGTTVTYGRAKGVTVATGMDTEFGKIAALLEDTSRVRTPLQKRLVRLGKALSFVALGVCTAVLLFGLLRGEEPLLMIMTAVSLAVAAIPESLPAVITISLALGAGKMARKNALVRKLAAVETLGSVTYICTDKTGTLTQNRMRAEEFYCEGGRTPEPGSGGLWEEFKKAMLLCNDSAVDEKGRVLGDPTETALFEAALRSGAAKDRIQDDYPRRLEIPFDAERKRMTTFHRSPDGRFVSYTKGAAAALTRDPAVLAVSEKMAHDGLRVLAFGTRSWEALPSGEALDRAEEDVRFLGLAGLIDPLRKEASSAVERCRSAGITPVMITGDHPGTAKAIAEQLRILDGDAEIMTGAELEGLSQEEFGRRVKRVRVYARVTPDQKLRIVQALQERGESVAMTGDGVNDAPALQKADIGISMGLTGTDVAKEASAMILLDDNFATIVKAVEEGRRMYDNMRRFVRYAVTTNGAEILIIFSAPFFGLPIPFLPTQILWINLLTDGLPGLALAAEPAEKDVMSRPPRSPREGVFAHGLGRHVVGIGALMAVLILGAQAWLVHHGAERWRSILFVSLCFSQLAHVLAIRSEKQSLFSQGVFSNKPLLLTVVLTILLQIGALYLPLFNDIFKTAPLTAAEWLWPAAMALVVFCAVELEKRAKRASGKPRGLPQDPPLE